MAAHVWVSRIYVDYRIGLRAGVREKLYGKGQEPAGFVNDPNFGTDLDAMNRCARRFRCHRRLPSARG